jgi:hypothetical protein
MEDARGNPVTSLQKLEQGTYRFTAMKNNREAEFHGQVELVLENSGLGLRGNRVPIIVQADFPDGDHLFRMGLDELPETGQRGLRVFNGGLRMDSGAGEKVGVLPGELDRLVGCLEVNPNIDDRFYASIPGPPNHGLAIFVELCKIEMGMGIDHVACLS